MTEKIVESTRFVIAAKENITVRACDSHARGVLLS